MRKFIVRAGGVGTGLSKSTARRIKENDQLDVVVLMFSVMMAVAGLKEPQIAGRATIRVLKQHMVKEPIFEAASSRSKELFAAAIGTTRDLSLRSGFVHGKTLCWGLLFYALTLPARA